jgi:hypothetical protein
LEQNVNTPLLVPTELAGEYKEVSEMKIVP